MQVPTVGPHLTHETFEHIHKWATDYDFNQYLRLTKRESGVDALWIPIDERYGIKVYRDEFKAGFCYHVGRILYHFDCAPRNFNFTKIAYRGRIYYAFVQERCEVYGLMSREEQSEYPSPRSDLYDKIKRTHFYPEDSHEFNIGILDGMPVYIDVGHFEIFYGY